MKKIGIFLAVFVIGLSGTTPLSGADIPDEQLVMPNPPVENTGGYSGAYYDDQSTLVRAFTYLETWDNRDFANAVYKTCKSLTEEPCASSDLIFFQTPISPCSDLLTKDCVISLAGRIGDGPFSNATLLETPQADFAQLGTEGRSRYSTPFTGDPNRKIPNSGLVSLWKIPGLTHQGGGEFLLIPKLNGDFQDRQFTKSANLDVGLFAVSRVSRASKPDSECFFTTKVDCYLRWAHPIGASFEVAVKTNAKIVGWFHGRLSTPEISSEKLADGQIMIKIQGAAINVPTLSVWAKNTDLPAKLEQMIEDEFVQRGNQFAGQAFYIGDQKIRATQAVIDNRNPSFDENYFARYMLWVGVAKDKAFASVSTWSFRTMQDYQGYAKCIGDSGVAGMVTTNSNAYMAGPPKFQDGDLTYRVASPHYDSKGEVQIGSYDLAIRSDIARCIYGFTSAPIQATLSVIYAEGEAKKATTLVSEKNNWLRLSAKGFTYSSPTINVKLTQAIAKPKKSVITCFKGKTSKKITAVNPKCPTGFKKE